MPIVLELTLLAGLFTLPSAAYSPAQAEMCVPAEVDGNLSPDGRLGESLPRERLENGRRLLEEGKPDRAVAELECVVRLLPGDAETRDLLGSAYLGAGRWPEAVEQYEQSLLLEPRNERVRLGIARVFLDAGLADEADQALATAAAMFSASPLPQYNQFYFSLAEIYADAGRVGNARDAMEAAIAREGPIDPVIMYKRLGDFLTHLLELDAAHEAYARALTIASDHLPARLARAALYLAEGRLDEALAEYQQALRLDPDAAEASSGAAEVHFRANRLVEAVTEARRAVALAPESPGPHYVLGRALQFAGQREEGRRELNEYRRLQESVLAEDHREREIHAYQSDAIARFYQGDAARAIAVLGNAISAYPEVPDLRFSLGLVLSQSGRHAEAVETYLKLLDLSPEAADRIHGHLARELRLAGDLEASERHRMMAGGADSAAPSANLPVR